MARLPASVWKRRCWVVLLSASPTTPWKRRRVIFMVTGVIEDEIYYERVSWRCGQIVCLACTTC